jgi:hypothetical protein
MAFIYLFILSYGMQPTGYGLIKREHQQIDRTNEKRKLKSPSSTLPPLSTVRTKHKYYIICILFSEYSSAVETNSLIISSWAGRNA